jgi:predicted DNA-binding protein
MQLLKRTNVLLTEEDHAFLSELVKNKGKTMGQLIRDAIKKTYHLENKKSGADISQRIKSGWKFLINPQKRLDYKKMVEYGRK